LLLHKNRTSSVATHSLSVSCIFIILLLFAFHSLVQDFFQTSSELAVGCKQFRNCEDCTRKFRGSCVEIGCCASISAPVPEETSPTKIAEHHRKRGKKFPMTNQVFLQAPEFHYGHVPYRLRRLERLTGDLVQASLDFISCVGPLWGKPESAIYKTCYVSNDPISTVDEPHPEYIAATVDATIKFFALSKRFPIYYLENVPDYKLKLFFEDERDLELAKENLRKVYLDSNGDIGYLTFSQKKLKPLTYQFAIKFKKDILRWQWLAQTFEFVMKFPIIEYFEIAPRGHTDVYFGIMHEFDKQKLKPHAIKICAYWQELEEFLSDDLRPFQYRKFCDSHKIAWSTFVGGHAHGYVLEEAFRYDARNILDANASWKSQLSLFPEEYQPCLKTQIGSDISTNDDVLRSCVIVTVDTWLYCEWPIEDRFDAQPPRFDGTSFDQCMAELMSKHFHSLQDGESPK